MRMRENWLTTEEGWEEDKKDLVLVHVLINPFDHSSNNNPLRNESSERAGWLACVHIILCVRYILFSSVQFCSVQLSSMRNDYAYNVK